jgi:hypothetical protein
MKWIIIGIIAFVALVLFLGYVVVEGVTQDMP